MIIFVLQHPQAFTRGSVRNFVMTTDQSLGDPLILRIWHDNSGKGANASWFLDKVVVEDLATSDRSVTHECMSHSSSAYFLSYIWGRCV